jgi:ferredoxin
VPQITYPEECWHCNACVEVCQQKGDPTENPLPMMILYKEGKRERRERDEWMKSIFLLLVCLVLSLPFLS